MRKNEGITLIILIITIVIMLILLGVSTKIIIDSKMFNKTETAVGQTNNRIKKDDDETNYLLGELDNTRENQCNHNWVDEKIIKQPTCREKGQKQQRCSKCSAKRIVEIPALGHNYVDGKCTECEETLIIGAPIDYHEYIGTDGNTLTTMPSYTSLKTTRGSTDSTDSDATYSVVNNSGIEWIVLGEEGNQIKITTKKIVQPISGGYTCIGYTGREFKFLSLEGQNGYTNFVDELNKIGAVYGHGKYADRTKFTTSGGRSFKMEDLGYNTLIRYKSCMYALEKHSGDIEAKVYRYDDLTMTTPDGTSTTGGKYSTFKYMALDASNSTQETETSHEWQELTEDNPVVTMYQYIYSGSQTLNYSIRRVDTDYWLASRYLNYADENVNYCARFLVTTDGPDGDIPWIPEGEDTYKAMTYSNDGYFVGSSGVRPVVYLQSGIKLSYDETSGYTISE